MQLTWLVGKRFISASKRICDWALTFEGDSVLITEYLWRVSDAERILLTSQDHGEKSHILVQISGENEVAQVFRDAANELSG